MIWSQQKWTISLKCKLMQKISRKNNLTTYCFTNRLSLRNAPMQILNQLPPNSGSLGFGAFACSPVLSDYGSSPGYGLSLTPSQLMSAVGSLCTNPFQPGSPYFNNLCSQSSPLAGSPHRGSQQSQSLPYKTTFKNLLRRL